MFEKLNEIKEVQTKSNKVEIKPLKDFAFMHNGHFYDLKKGKSTEVDKIFLPNLKTENVIKK